MTQSLPDRLQEGNFKDLAGTELYFKIPLTRDFLNWNIKQSLPKKLKKITIHSIQGRTISLTVETTIAILPDFDITVELDESLHPPRLELRMTITDGLGWVVRSVVDKVLPDGIDIEGKVVTVDLYHFLFEKRQYRTIVDKITFARWVGAQDKVFLEFELKF